MTIGLIILALAVAAGVAIFISEKDKVPSPFRVDPSGWIYFICGEEGPVKVGMTAFEPTRQRLPELSTMSPVPLRVYFKAYVPDRRLVERALHAELAPYREHGEWFDRDAALYFADHLKGEL